MSDPTFFGFGSLVNLKTHDYTHPKRAQVSGWRRIWRSTSVSDVAVLSVTPAPDTTLDGIKAEVPGADWAALDERENAYNRKDLPDGTAIYEVKDELIIPGAAPYPIHRSYLDVVVQGYLHEFGPDGAARFFITTDNWGPILDDRADPQYPRHQTLSSHETAFVDKHLAAIIK